MNNDFLPTLITNVTSLIAVTTTLIGLSKTKWGADFIEYVGNHFSVGANKKIKKLQEFEKKQLKINGEVAYRLEKGEDDRKAIKSEIKIGDNHIEQKLDMVFEDVKIIKECLLGQVKK